MVTLHRGRVAGLFVIAAAAVAVLAGCAGTSSSSAAQAAKSNISAVATSPAVLHAEQVAKVEVVNPCKANLPLHFKKFISCAEGKLAIQGDSPDAQAKRGALESCLFEAGNADNVLKPGNHIGRLHFEQVGAPNCIAQILLANSLSSPSMSPSGKSS